MLNRSKAAPLIFLILSLILSGCARDKTPEKVIVATVNGEPIYEKDLKKEVALRAKQDPSYKLTPQTFEEQLNIMINRRLLIQQAMKKRLAEEKRFVNTIRSFWEQTLIRDLMDYKKQESKDYIFVMEDEVKEYYKKMSFKVTFKIIRSKDKDYLDKLLEKVEPIKWERTIGPITYEDVNSEILFKAFDLEQGKTKIFQDKDLYYLVYVAEKNTLTLPPLNSQLYSRIKERIRGKKQEQDFNKWLREIKSKSDIKINRDVLSGDNNAG